MAAPPAVRSLLRWLTWIILLCNLSQVGYGLLHAVSTPMKDFKGGDVADLTFTFGELESRLAELHAIADSKRTAFQARLKNFHRLGFPRTLETSKGKTARYSPSLLVEMALSVQLTELGLAPDRVVTILNNSLLPVALAIREAASTLHDQLVRNAASSRVRLQMTGRDATYLTIDPAALWPLTREAELGVDTWDMARLTLFCLRGTAAQRDLMRLTSYSGRISLVNVTAIVGQLATPPANVSGAEELGWIRSFLEEVLLAARRNSEFKSDFAAAHLVRRFLQMKGVTKAAATDGAFTEQVAQDMYVSRNAVREGVRLFLEQDSRNGGNQKA